LKTPANPAPLSLFGALHERAGLYSELSKSRLSALVVVTAGAGYAAGTPVLDPATLASLCVGTSLAAGSANTFNQWIERNRDKRMKRTANRPLPSGRMEANEALGWGVFSAGSSCAILAAGTNPVTAGLGAFNIGLYALPYTLSKPRTEWNTWIGAVVGAIPPVMGWTAAGGDLVAMPPALLGATLFLWQFPHFFALAWIHRKDYARGGHQMVPVNDPSGERTAALIQRYSLAMLPLPLAASSMDVTSWMYALEGTAATSYLLYLSQEFKQDRSNDNARKVFKCSLWYLPLLLGLFVFHRKRQESEGEETAMEAAKAAMKSMCLHEALSTPHGGKILCPKVDAVKRGPEGSAK